MFGRSSITQQKLGDYRSGTFGYDPLVQDYWTMATLDGINNLLRVMSVPPTGFFMRRMCYDGLVEAREHESKSQDRRNHWTR